MRNKIHKNKYKFITDNIVISCVDVCLQSYSGQIFLVKRAEDPAKGLWWFPGGRIHIGETIEEAAIRKVKEETNIDISDRNIYRIGFDETIFRHAGKIIRHSLNAVVRVTLLPAMQNEIKLDNTSSEWVWHNEIKNLDPYVTKFIRICR